MTTCYFALMQRHPFRKQGDSVPDESYSQPEIRVQQIEEMINNAEIAFAGSGHPQPEVKIAICPEHFLARQHGKKISSPSDGRYFNEISEVIPILQQLTLISKSRPDWLIIPGSITVFAIEPQVGSSIAPHMIYTDEMVKRTNSVSPNATRQNASLKTELEATQAFISKRPDRLFRPCYNVAPIYLAGKIIKIRRKKYEAFGDRGSLDVIGSGSESGYFPMSTGSAVFEHKGLTIGVEICVEHEHGLLKAEAPAGLDLHIIISNEVYPFLEHASLKENGALVHVDTNTTGVYRKNELVSSDRPDTFQAKNIGEQKTHFIRQTVGVEAALNLNVGP